MGPFGDMYDDDDDLRRAFAASLEPASGEDQYARDLALALALSTAQSSASSP